MTSNWRAGFEERELPRLGRVEEPLDQHHRVRSVRGTSEHLEKRGRILRNDAAAGARRQHEVAALQVLAKSDLLRNAERRRLSSKARHELVEQ